MLLLQIEQCFFFFVNDVQKIEMKLIIAFDYDGTCRTSGSHDPWIKPSIVWWNNSIIYRLRSSPRINLVFRLEDSGLNIDRHLFECI